MPENNLGFVDASTSENSPLNRAFVADLRSKMLIAQPEQSGQENLNVYIECSAIYEYIAYAHSNYMLRSLVYRVVSIRDMMGDIGKVISEGSFLPQCREVGRIISHRHEVFQRNAIESSDITIAAGRSSILAKRCQIAARDPAFFTTIELSSPISTAISESSWGTAQSLERKRLDKSLTNGLVLIL